MLKNEKHSTLRTAVQWSDYSIDPRYFVLLFLLSFVLGGQIYLNFYQKWDAIIAAIATTSSLELLIVRIFHGKWKFPLSAVITGFGISLLISSYLLWPFILTAFLAITIKFLVRYKGGHIFNPNNVAVVLVLFFLPQFVVSTPKQWTNGFEVMAVILSLGILACFIAQRLDTVISFLSGFVLFAFVRHLFFGAPLLAALGPLMGAALQLFMFFMITDPKTTPTTRKARIAFGLCVAAVDAIFRINRFANPQFYALFLVTLIGIPLYRMIVSKRMQTLSAN
ncbi:RnfABCDGE type electron transport complex subunit D [Longirhabdus pacifica]|uniref:RnfABCDGE type electron transport complex subunit D n=1 Tax=Longirhabdus pacifica TaxID=2305227 RepID=UPI0010092FA5|nr:RnfABCDGE type electron transport complex subunit D [Longirhabdus pacifica]